MKTFLSSVDHWHGGNFPTAIDDEGHTRKPPFAIPRKTEDIILAIKGWSAGDACNIIESYDYRADKWTISDLKDLQGKRGYQGAAVIGTKLYLVGGTDGARYFNTGFVIDLESGVSKRIAPMHSARCYVSMVSMDGCLYTAGGFDGIRRLSSLECYDPDDNQWKIMARMKKVRSDAGCAVVGQKICIAGGFDGQNQLNTVEVYNVKSDKWTTLPRMTTKRSGLSCAGLGGELYVLGGYDGVTRLATCEKYNFQTKQWTRIGNMLTPRSNFAACVYQEKILVFGGFDGIRKRITDRVEAYQKTENSWMKRRSIEVERSALAACVVPGLGMKRQVLEGFKNPTREQGGNNICPDCGGLHNDQSYQDSSMDSDVSTDEDLDDDSEQISFENISSDEVSFGEDLEEEDYFMD